MPYKHWICIFITKFRTLDPPTVLDQDMATSWKSTPRCPRSSWWRSPRLLSAFAAWPVLTPGLFTPCLPDTWNHETFFHTDKAAFPYLGVGWYYPVPVCSDVVFLAFETIFLFSLLPKMDVIDSYYNLRYFDAWGIELAGGSPGFLIIWIFFTFLEYLRTFVLS